MRKWFLKQKARKLSKIIGNLTINDLCADTKRFVEDIQEEPDRSVPIIAVAFLDDVLRKLLEAHFVDNKKVVNQLLEYPGPVSSFASRADIAYCLGLIPPKSYGDIRLIRKIRNKCSHSHTPVSFEDTDIAEICKKFFCPSLTTTGLTNEMTPRSRFILTAIFLANTILLQALSIKQNKSPKDYEMGEFVKA